MSKVSVVVPIYNAGRKLDKCIKSILDQTFKDFELVLVNDGSTDSSLDICKEYEKKDSRVILINKKNEGCIAARRCGIEESNSDYVMFVDADDWIDKNTIDILYTESIKNNVDITVCNTYKVLGNGTLFKKKNQSWYFNEDKVYNKDQIKNELIVAYFHGHPFPASLVAKLYKKELLLNNGKYLKRVKFLGEDLYYNLEIFLQADTVKVIKSPLYYYRVGGTTSKYMSYMFDDMINGYYIQKEVIDEYYQDSRAKRYNGISVMLLNTFKTCLQNLFSSKLSKMEIVKLLREYTSNDAVVGCLSNEGCIKYFPSDYLNAIKNKDVEYLFNIGQKMHSKSITKKYLMSLISKIV
jgi:glycosyltransferase involved in cell wall biosynthesis